MTVVEDKARLREQMAARAAALDPEQRRVAEADMRARLLELPELESANGVLVCLSYGIEPETRPLLAALAEAGKRVYLPRADREDRQLHVHPWPCELHELRFGLQQPARGAPELGAEQVGQALDLAVILGLAFDHRGVRLGHGSGYVDRFLAAHPIPAIGLSFAAQVVDRLPRATYDVPMALVVSEDRILRPAGE